MAQFSFNLIFSIIILFRKIKLWFTLNKPKLSFKGINQQTCLNLIFLWCFLPCMLICFQKHVPDIYLNTFASLNKVDIFDRKRKLGKISFLDRDWMKFHSISQISFNFVRMSLKFSYRTCSFISMTLNFIACAWDDEKFSWKRNFLAKKSECERKLSQFIEVLLWEIFRDDFLIFTSYFLSCDVFWA